MQKQVKLLTIYFVIFLVISGVLFFLHIKFGTPNIVLLTILIANLVALLIYLTFLPSYNLQLFLITLAVSTGVYGFLNYSNTTHMSILDALYFTVRMFFLNMDEVVHQSGGIISSYPLSLEIARWAAAIYTVSTLFTVASRLFGQSVKLFWYQIFGNHYVIYGYHQQTKVLLHNLRREKKKVVLVSDAISEADKSYIESLGVVVLYNHLNDGKRFKKSRLKSAGYYLIFHEDDTRNLDELIALKNQFYQNESKSKFLKLKIYVHLTHQQSYDIYEKN